MVFLLIVLLILMVVGYLFWRSYEEKKVANEYDRGSAWAGTVASLGQTAGGVLTSIFGRNTATTATK